jgi:large subunit ribosomal protein L18
MSKKSKVVRRTRLKRHIRHRVSGTAERPRLSVYRSLNDIYVQLIDDDKAVTLVAASTKGKAVEPTLKGKKKSDKSKAVGELIAKKAIEKGFKKVVFDRNGYRYHGRVKALADAAREAGLEF